MQVRINRSCNLDFCLAEENKILGLAANYPVVNRITLGSTNSIIFFSIETNCEQVLLAGN